MSNLRKSYDRVALPGRRAYSRRATSNGLLDGPNNMIGDYSSGAVDFWCEPDADQVLQVTNVFLLLSDLGEPGETDYGNIAGGLNAGIRFFVELAGERQYTQTVLKNNIDIIGAADSFRIHALANNVRVTAYQRLFRPDTDDYVVYDVPTAKFGCTVEDNFTALNQHILWIKGSQQIARVATFALAALLLAVPFMYVGVTI